MNCCVEDNKYSVLMSVYKNDDPNFLTIAIESMLNQTVPPEQFVIVEDGIVGDEIEKVVFHGVGDENLQIYDEYFNKN